MIKIIHNKKTHPFAGMKVKIREDLKPNKFYDSIWVNERMVEYCGKEAKTRHYDTILKRFSLDIDKGLWCWSKEMLIPLE